MKQRVTYIGRDLTAGCDECHGDNGHWFGKNAQAVAARHHDATGHRTWVDVYMHISYGKRDEEPTDKAAELVVIGESGEVKA